MSRTTLLLVYAFFFFMYFFGFGIMGSVNAGVPFPWYKQFQPLDLSFYAYTLTTVCLTHFVVLRRLYYQRPRWKLIAGVVALLCFFILLRYTLEEMLLPVLTGKGNYYPGTSFRYYAIDNIYYGSMTVFIGFVLFMFDELFRRQKKEAELKQQNREAELRFLQAQMNPHFLFNSLNNIYSLSVSQHPDTPAAVLKLSEMMRYVTYEKESAVLLEKEMEYVENLISLHQLRLDYKLAFAKEIAAGAGSCRVIPLLLVPLVENALKHGDLSDPGIPLTIKAEHNLQQLSIMVSNKKGSAAPVAEAGGVGLENLRRRLELVYGPGQFRFITEEKDTIFSIRLIIPFS